MESDRIDEDALEALREAEADDERVEEDKTMHIFTSKYTSGTPFNPVLQPDNSFSSSPPAFSSPLSGPSAKTQNLAVPSDWALKRTATATPLKKVVVASSLSDDDESDEESSSNYKFPAWMNINVSAKKTGLSSVIPESQDSAALDFNESDAESTQLQEPDMEKGHSPIISLAT
ncbi:UNVERIFIED_CONTAM: hypothetical protein HDU68_005762, partial [Siphonaria sp. JEL0065]